MLSVHATDYSYPEFVLNRGYTFTVTYGGTGTPMRYRGLDHLPLAAGTIAAVEPDEVVQSLATGPTAANFTTFTLLDPQPLRDVTTDRELSRLGRPGTAAII